MLAEGQLKGAKLGVSSWYVLCSEQSFYGVLYIANQRLMQAIHHDAVIVDKDLPVLLIRC